MSLRSESKKAREASAIVAAREIQRQTGVTSFNLAIVFGTGWDAAVEELGQSRSEFVATDFTGFMAPTVEGHAGMIRHVRTGPSEVLVFRGRKHRYEFAIDNEECLSAVVHSIRVAEAAGCQTIILTNAVGGLRSDLHVGDAVLISDHNDLITAAPSPLFGPAFLDCAQVYDPLLRHACHRLNHGLTEGVYAQVRGPHFETPAAADFLRRNGVDIVGMSIIQEAIMAHSLKLRVLGISLVTDVIGDTITHEKVQAGVRARAPELGQFLRRLIEQL